MASIQVEMSVCDLCGTCVGVCPVDCIELNETELKIDQGVCILCRMCVEICPIGALEMDDE